MNKMCGENKEGIKVVITSWIKFLFGKGYEYLVISKRKICNYIKSSNLVLQFLFVSIIIGSLMKEIDEWITSQLNKGKEMFQ